jgi:regulator of cell morphogenesis and NO signaling
MSTATPTKQVREYAIEQPSSVRVFERFGIDYCCGGRKSLDQACAELQLSVDQVLDKIEEAAHGRQAESPDEWTNRPLFELCDHIVQHHHDFTREELPRLVRLARTVNAKHGIHMPQMAEIDLLLEELQREMSMHMLKEEQVLFPHITRLEEAEFTGEPVFPAFFGSVSNPIAAMIAEHDDAGEIMAKLSKLTNHFTPPSACAKTSALYHGIREFERDMHRHVHLENNILFPRAFNLEQGQ